MRNLEVIETELTAAREALSGVKGTPAEVYTRIVGYYRSVRNWNRGKREEYGERVMFRPDTSLLASCRPNSVGAGDGGVAFAGAVSVGVPATAAVASAATTMSATAVAAGVQAEAEDGPYSGADGRILLFVRPACPSCPSAKAAAGRLGIPLELFDADTEEGLAEAVRRQVMSTPTAILLSPNGKELGRARDAQAIERLLDRSA